MSNDTVDVLTSFVDIFITLYIVLILVQILLSFLPRVPFNMFTYRLREYLTETVNPFLALFRRILPPFGPLDLSPMIAIFALYALRIVVISILDGFRPS